MFIVTKMIMVISIIMVLLKCAGNVQKVMTQIVLQSLIFKIELSNNMYEMFK